MMKAFDNTQCWPMVEMGRLGTDCLFKGSAALLITFSLCKELEKEVDGLKRLHSCPGFNLVLFAIKINYSMAFCTYS